MKVLTKKQFLEGMENNVFDVRPNDIVYTKNATYKLKVYKHEDKVVLIKI